MGVQDLPGQTLPDGGAAAPEAPGQEYVQPLAPLLGPDRELEPANPIVRTAQGLPPLIHQVSGFRDCATARR